MKHFKKILPFLLALSLLSACGGGEQSSEETAETSSESKEDATTEANDAPDTGEPLTDAKVKKYIALMKNIKEDNPDFGDGNTIAGLANLNTYLAKHGFDGLQDFTMTNLKITSSYAHLQAESENVSEQYQEGQDKVIKELEEKLNDKSITEDEKTALQQTLKALKESKDSDEMKNMTQEMLDGYSQMANEEEKTIVKKNLPALKKVLDGN